MASEERSRSRVGRKLTKKRKESRRISLDIPERFKDGDDAQDDVTAPKRKETMAMNQSLFSMITRAGHQSQTHLGTTDELDSGESDDEERKVPYHSLDGAARLSRISTSNDFGNLPGDVDGSKASSSKQRRALSEHKLLRSLPKLKIAGRKESKTEGQQADQMSSSQFLPARTTPEELSKGSPDERPLQPKAKVTPGEDIHVEKRRTSKRSRSRHGSTAGLPKGRTPVSLAQRLQQIFEFEELEEVISEYPCWLLQSILLQGYMYITQKHICFYAYLPKKHNDVSKTGYLSKRGRSKYNRYWFILKGDVLAYYTNSSDLYFPRNRINLQYAISADVLEAKDKGKDDTVFVVTTDERTYQFKADSAMSAKEWVRSIQKVIFRTHNEGNSVKISLPIQNVLEIEDSTILDFAETFKVRVIDNDETYAMDEYFFSFFSRGQDALNVLRIMINDNDHHQRLAREADQSATTPTALGVHSQRQGREVVSSPIDNPLITENVRATLSPLPAPHIARSSISVESGRSSFDTNRKSYDVRRSMDASRSLRRPSYETRRSFSGNRQEKNSKTRAGDKSPLSSKPQDSSGSATNSYDPETESSAVVQSLDESNVSASQILKGSEVFRTPPIHPPSVVTSDKSDSVARHSQDTTRLPASHSHLKTPAPSRPPRRGSPGGSHSPLGTPELEDEADAQHTSARLSTSSSALQDIAAYPIQKASGLAGFLRTRSKRMGNLLATESMGYYEKVSGMLAGGRKHYTTAEGLETDDQVHDLEEDDDTIKAAENFREHFAFPDTEQLQSSFFASLQKIVPIYGKIYISGRHFCFRSLLPTSKTKIILPIRDIENINKERGFQPGQHGLAVVIRGHEELFFQFRKAEYRDECAICVLRLLETIKYMDDDEAQSSSLDSDDEAAKVEHDLLQEAREGDHSSSPSDMSHFIRGADQDRIPLVFDDPQASIVEFKPPEPLNIVCLTIGSRGDVQPYIALCKEFLKEGHKPRIATHIEFEDWIRGHGIDFAPVHGNPAELMQICVEHGMFTYGFIKEANSKFRGWLDDVCSSAWKASQGADVLIESPSAMAGIHIAEALGIPYLRAFTMPWTRTRTYPHAFAVPDRKLGGAYNSASYQWFDKLFWVAIKGQLNRWRRRELGLQGTGWSKMAPNSRPFLYNFSKHVVPPPGDWPDWVKVTGYWFLDESDNYEPPEDLVAFIAKARKDNKKLVYIGFGSIVIDDSAVLTQTVVDSVLKADVRCVLSKGWSDRLENKNRSKPEVPLPPELFQIQAAPHDWLFKQMDAAVHHGGSGTTGASLRAGIPTIIKPFFGDQFFFAQRVEDLSVGVWMKKLNTSFFSRALWVATNDVRIINRAKRLGVLIRKENGAQLAVETIYRELDRARALVKKHTKPDDDTDDFEDEWTMIEEDEQLELSKQFEITEPLAGMSRASTDGSRLGAGSLALGSMAMKGAGASKRDSTAGQ
ncbi:glycosyltransferase family 1 protein [Lophiostoma macrostomum CBS 122681]|uniref:Sterol 3-beta-glucosyltransferase n=1 Tax=Lophiostoma macrostomum CBS 122681 TaxID=1314788 RepID=A0A6A6TPL2_9PLEO|nr:glycosyltransferase family 1 protein [Lophiostoma macrostomum CBS 122681]